MTENRDNFELRFTPTCDDGGGDLVFKALNKAGKRIWLKHNHRHMEPEEFMERLNDETEMEFFITKANQDNTRDERAFNVVIDVPEEWAKPYLDYFKEITGSVPEAQDLTQYYPWGGLKYTHYLKQCVWTGDTFRHDIWVSSSDNFGQQVPKEAARKRAEAVTYRTFGKTIPEPEYKQSSNGSFVTNRRYACGLEDYEPYIHAAWVLKPMLHHWLMCKGTPGQKDLIAQHESLFAKSKLTPDIYKQTLTVYSGLRTSWESPTISWKEFRNTK